MFMRNNYWSCSKFADWVRGTAKPVVGTNDEWNDWTNAAKMKHSFRYWLAEEGINYVQKFVYYIPDRLHDTRYYIINRWVSRSHALTAHPRDIKPGQWRDVGSRFLPCMFNELVDFVEIEQAWHHCMWSDEAKTEYKVPFWRKGWLRLRTWRCAKAGLAYLDWASKLKMDESWGIEPGNPNYGKLTDQAKSAKAILKLYRWWKEVRPARPDVYDITGWSEYCDKNQDMFSDRARTKKRTAESRTILYKVQELEAAHEAEDTKMMIELIKLRNSLWT